VHVANILGAKVGIALRVNVVNEQGTIGQNKLKPDVDDKLGPRLQMRVVSYSDLMGSTGSMDTDELGPSDLKQNCPTVSEVRSVSLSKSLISSGDDQIVSFFEEPILPFYEEQMVSLHDEEEINVVSTNEASEDATMAEPPTPKRRLGES